MSKYERAHSSWKWVCWPAFGAPSICTTNRARKLFLAITNQNFVASYFVFFCLHRKCASLKSFILVRQSCRCLHLLFVLYPIHNSSSLPKKGQQTTYMPESLLTWIWNFQDFHQKIHIGTSKSWKVRSFFFRLILPLWQTIFLWFLMVQSNYLTDMIIGSSKYAFHSIPFHIFDATNINYRLAFWSCYVVCNRSFMQVYSLIQTLFCSPHGFQGSELESSFQASSRPLLFLDSMPTRIPIIKSGPTHTLKTTTSRPSNSTIQR